jgi:AcrR family transcriptional regulator
MSIVNRPTATRARSRPRRRRRLSVEARREELLRVGAELFGKYGYEDVGIEDVAAATGASTALLYHYFPNKRRFFLAVAQSEAERIAALTEPTAGASVAEGVGRSIEAFLDDVEAHPQGHLAIQRARGDAEVRVILERLTEVEVDRILAAVTGGREAPELLRRAVRAWMAFLEQAVVDWIERPGLERAVLRDLLLGSLLGTIRAAQTIDPELPVELTD